MDQLERSAATPAFKCFTVSVIEAREPVPVVRGGRRYGRDRRRQRRLAPVQGARNGKERVRAFTHATKQRDSWILRDKDREFDVLSEPLFADAQHRRKRGTSAAPLDDCTPRNVTQHVVAHEARKASFVMLNG